RCASAVAVGGGAGGVFVPPGRPAADAIEHVTVRDRAVEQDGVEAGGHDPLIGPAVPGTGPDDAVQVVQGSHAGQVSFDERHAEPDAVRVGVIEPGQHDTVVRVDALARPQALDIVPGGDDPSVEDSNAVHAARRGVTGVDPPVLDDQIDHHLP